MGLFTKLNPNLETDGPELLKTVAAFMPLSKVAKYNTTALQTALKFVPTAIVFKALFGKKGVYGDGEKLVGERFLDHVQGLNVGRRDVPDEAVAAAQVFLTIMLGVRIKVQEDLDALDKGVDAYMARPGMDDIPRAAVQRAVKLKQTYYPASSYNQGPWDLTHAQNTPLVAPIPAIEYGKLMNGGVQGIGQIVDGIPQNPDFVPDAGSGKPTPSTPGAGSLDSTSTKPATTSANAGELPPSNIPPEVNPGTSSTRPIVLYSLIGVGVIIIGVAGYFAFKKNK